MREFLRSIWMKADVGISRANHLIAETSGRRYVTIFRIGGGSKYSKDRLTVHVGVKSRSMNEMPESVEDSCL
ncbi:MAG: hypothetical protein ACUVTL_04650 [Thermoproteota archaeon]